MTQTCSKLPSLCYRAVEFRAEPDSNGRILEGYAAVFDQPTRIDSWEGEFDEVIKRGAFAKTIKERTPVVQFDHGRDIRTGSVPIGTPPNLREDAQGLFVHTELFDNPVIEPIRQAIEAQAIDGMSFRFQVVREKWYDKNGKEIPASELSDLLWRPGDRGPLKREILEVKLFELGPVVFPAYEGTTVGVRSLLASLDSPEREALIRELAAELRPVVDIQHSDAGRAATSDVTPDAAPAGTSGLSLAEREHALRELDLRLRRAS